MYVRRTDLYEPSCSTAQVQLNQTRICALEYTWNGERYGPALRVALFEIWRGCGTDFDPHRVLRSVHLEFDLVEFRNRRPAHQRRDHE